MESAGHERPTDISGCTCVLHIFLAHAQYYGSSWGCGLRAWAWERCGSRGQVSAGPTARLCYARTVKNAQIAQFPNVHYVINNYTTIQPSGCYGLCRSAVRLPHFLIIDITGIP